MNTAATPGGAEPRLATPLDAGSAVRDARRRVGTGRSRTPARQGLDAGQATSLAQTSAQTIRVLIVDDHPLARAGLRQVISTEADLEVIGEAESGLDAVRQAERLKPDLVFMDIRMPGMDGVEATRQILARQPTIAIVCVTLFEDPEPLLAALRAGARGYVLKDVSPEVLLGVVRGALAGHPTVEAGLATHLLERIARESHADGLGAPDPLTPREIQVVRLVAHGLTNREIAGGLAMAVGTVKVHLEHILGKLGAVDRTEAAVRAVELGLVSRDDAQVPGDITREIA
ncbi:MAG: response regulator transcription factor [Chloroflexi bacterium]|nr:response regulator transcription factor [Chloroflexota bacterium]